MILENIWLIKSDFYQQLDRCEMGLPISPVIEFFKAKVLRLKNLNFLILSLADIYLRLDKIKLGLYNKLIVLK